MPFAQRFVARGAIDHTGAQLKATSTGLSILSVGAGGGLKTRLGKVSLSLVGIGGYYLGVYDSKTGGSLFYAIDTGADIEISPGWAIGLGAGWTDYLSTPTSFYRGSRLRLGLKLDPPAAKAGSAKPQPRMQIPSVTLSPVFPVVYKYFDTTPLGSARIPYQEKGEIKNVKLSFFIPQFMDGPKTCEEIPSMKTGEARDVKLYALLKDSVLNITEGTKVQASVIVSYTLGESRLQLERSETIRIYDRNAMTWEDDRRAASFVTAKDPMVMKFSKAVNAVVRDEASPVANLNFRIALGMFEALGLHGLRYTVNPKGSYAEFAVNKFAVDYLQFPQQTLRYKGGDCSDISILYSALLESIGIETAFITIPGHIFLAFAPGIDSADSRGFFSNTEDLIASEGKFWFPVEITMVKEGFLKAWKEGAREWRENGSDRKFYPLHEAWKIYEPVGMSDGESALQVIPEQEFRSLYRSEINAFTSREILAREAGMRAELAGANPAPAALNRLGILYAQFGLLEKAKEQFELAVRKKEFLPALVNLGNLAFLRKDWAGAMGYYQKAQKLGPDNPSVLIGVAKAEYESENCGAAKMAYVQAVAIQPDLASKYSFLSEKRDKTRRAASVLPKEAMSWSEE